VVHAGQRVAHAYQVTVLPSDINQQLAKMRKVWKKLQKKVEGTVYEGTSKHLMDELMEREDRRGITMEYLHAVGQFHVVEELPVDARCPLAAACSL
jgi:transcriptional regulator